MKARKKIRSFAAIPIVLIVGIGFTKNFQSLWAGTSMLVSGEKLSVAVDTLEAELAEKFSHKRELIEINGGVHKVLAKREMNDVLLLENGHGTVLMNDVSDLGLEANSRSVKQFSDFCEERGAAFVYMQCPYKNKRGESLLPAGCVDYSNDVADRFLENLEKHGVNYLDIRACIEQDEVDFYSLFLKTEHHWSPYGGFYAFTKLCEHFGETYGDEINPMYLDINNYHQEICEKKSLGYYGQRTGGIFLPAEEYTLIYPKFETRQTCAISHSKVTRTGDFYDAIFDTSSLESEESEGLYGTYIGGDFPWVMHESETAPIDKTVIMFIDSFGTIPESFLTTVYKRVYAFDLRWILRYGYTETAAYLVDTYAPDYVVVSFNPNQLGYEESEQFKFGIE